MRTCSKRTQSVPTCFAVFPHGTRKPTQIIWWPNRSLVIFLVAAWTQARVRESSHFPITWTWKLHRCHLGRGVGLKYRKESPVQSWGNQGSWLLRKLTLNSYGPDFPAQPFTGKIWFVPVSDTLNLNCKRREIIAPTQLGFSFQGLAVFVSVTYSLSSD